MLQYITICLASVPSNERINNVRNISVKNKHFAASDKNTNSKVQNLNIILSSI